MSHWPVSKIDMSFLHVFLCVCVKYRYLMFSYDKCTSKSDGDGCAHVHQICQMPNQVKSDGSLPFFVLLMITTQVLHSGPLEQDAPRDIRLQTNTISLSHRPYPTTLPRCHA